MAQIGTLVSFVASTPIASADANGNFTAVRDAFNNTAVLTDVARTITVGHTINPTSGNVLTATPFVGGKGIVINTAIQVTSQPLMDYAQTWNAAGVTFTGLKFNVTDTASAAASLLLDLQVGGVSKFRVDKAGGVLGFAKILYQNQALTTTSAVKVALASYSLPAGTLAVNGQIVRVVITGQTAVQNAHIYVDFGATIGTQFSLLFPGNNIFEFRVTIVRTGAATQVITYESAIASAVSSLGRATATETLSGAVTISFLGDVVAGGTLTFDSVRVEHLTV